jgi:hypothetical protein
MATEITLTYKEVKGMNTNVSRAANFLSGYAKKAGFIGGLAALIGVLLVAGCAHKPEAPPQKTESLQDLVHKEISDPARAEKVLALMEQMDARIKLQNEMNQQAQQAFLNLNADYNTTPEQFQQHMDSARASRDENRQKIMDAYFQIKALTTQQEWEALSKPGEQRLMDFLNKTEVPDKKHN